MQERFEDTKRVIRGRKLKRNIQYNVQIKKAKGQTMIYKTKYIYN